MLQRTRLGQKVAGSYLRGFPLRVISSQDFYHLRIQFSLERDGIINSFFYDI